VSALPLESSSRLLPPFFNEKDVMQCKFTFPRELFLVISISEKTEETPFREPLRLQEL
jgi:hypothetical protein